MSGTLFSTTIVSDVQVLVTSNDSLNAPGFAYNGDSNTGFFHPSTGNVAFVSQGTERIRFAGAGRIGVATSNPACRVCVADYDGTTETSQYAIMQIAQNSNGNALGNSNQALLALHRSNAYRVGMGFVKGLSIFGFGHAQLSNTDFSPTLLAINSNGNVGIGTASPSEVLHVSGGKVYSDTQVLASSNDSVSVPAFSFKEESNTGMFHAAASTLGFTTAGTERMRIDSGGNIAIGTNTNANARFYVFGNPSVFSRGNSFINSPAARLANTSGTPALCFSTIGITDSDDKARICLRTNATSNAGILTFFTGVSNALVENMCIDNNGNVGVGTSNPVYKLDVAGDINFTGTLRSNGVAFVGGGGGGGGTTSHWSNNSSNVYINLNSNVGIGTTTPATAMHILGGNITLETGSFAVNASSSTYINFVETSFNDRFGILTEFAGTGDTNRVSITTNSTGSVPTSNDAKLTIVQSGNVGIGTLAPTTKLDVNGTINATAYQGTTITNLSNMALFGSNTSVAASNTSIWASNTSVAASNTSIWASNNLLRKGGDTMTGTLNMSANLPMITLSNSTAFADFGMASVAGNFSTNTNAGDTVLRAFTTGTRLFLQSGNGASALCINSNNSIGVNTPTPVETFHVNGKIFCSNQILASSTVDSSNVPAFSWREDSNTGIFHHSTSAIGFVTGGTTKCIVDSLGNVSIGGSNPLSRLDVTTCSNVHPPAAMTSTTQIFGSASYTISSSFTTGGAILNAFDKNTATIWEPTNGGYVGGAWSGSLAINTTISGTVYGGHWVQIQLPSAIIVTELGIFPKTGSIFSPATTYLAGSSDGTTWTMVNSWADIGLVQSQYNYYTINPNLTPYSYYRLVFNSTKGSGNVAVNEVVFNSIASSIVTSGNVGVGLSTPIERLHVNGKVYASNQVLSSASNDSSNIPSFSWREDSNTGIYHPTTSTLGFSTAGVARMVINSSGNIGVGVETPIERLHVNGKVYASNQVLSSATNDESNVPSFSWREDSNTGIYHPTTSTLGFSTAGVPRMFINSTGNVGIGLSNPSQRLHVSGNEFVTGIVSAGDGGLGYGNPVTFNAFVGMNSTFGAGCNVAIQLGRVTALNESWFLLHAHLSNTSPSNYFQISAYASGNTGLVVQAGGNVGIGTTSPVHRLHVAGDINFTGTLRQNGSVFTGSHWSNNSSNVYVNTGSNVGIATSTPSFPLHVVGKVYTDTQLLVSSNDSATTPGYSYLGNSNTGMFHSALDTLGFSTNGTSRMVIDSSGKVGVGTASPSQRLHVIGNGIVSGTVSAGDGGLGFVNTSSYNALVAMNSTFGAGSNVVIQLGRSNANNDSWFIVHAHVGNGSISNSFNIAPYGNASFFTILASGNVGLGTTAPSQRLHVVGNIFATGDIVAFSDKRLKSNIKIIDNALSRVHQLNGYTFDVHGDTTNKRHTGLIAQEVKTILPEAVYKNVDDEMYSIAYGNISGLLVQAIKELDDRYKKQINTMNKKVKKLQTDIKRYKKACKRHAF
jgi:hypothetical protein